MTEPTKEVVGQAFFERLDGEVNGKHVYSWTWVQKAMNGEAIAQSDQPFDRVGAALNNFLSVHGYSNWQVGELIPEGFSGFHQIDADHHRIDIYGK